MESLYQSAISSAGLDGTFQIQFDIMYNVVLVVLWTMAYNNIILALTVPPHTCDLPMKPENIREHEWKLQFIPLIKDSSELKIFSQCLIYTNTKVITNVTKECDSYNYDKTWFETTIPSEYNWVCRDKLNVANIFAYGRTSEIFGSLFFGWFGDVYGRKPTYIISLVMLVIGRFLSVIGSSSFILFATGCVIASFPSWSVIQSTAIISMEITSPKRRSTVATIKLVASSFGMFLMPFFFWWLKNWKPFLIITTISLLPFILCSWKFIESPQWLWVNNKANKCVKELEYIAKRNGNHLDNDIKNEILTNTPHSTNKTEILGPLSLFAGWRLSFLTILQSFLWICISINYNVVIMSAAEKSKGNPFLDFAWQSLAEIPGYFIAAWLADRIGRRYTGMTSMAVITIIWIINLYREMSATGWMASKWLVTSLVVINRLSITMSYFIINLFNMELYPTCLRQSGMSVGNVISGGASAIAPFILYLGDQFDTRYSNAILIFATLGGLLSAFLLPETLNAKLPETLEDAQNFGRRQLSGLKNISDKSESDDEYELRQI